MEVVAGAEGEDMRLLMLPTRERFASMTGSSGPGLSGRFTVDGGETRFIIAGCLPIECGDICGGPRLSGGERRGWAGAPKLRGSFGPRYEDADAIFIRTSAAAPAPSPS